MVKYKFHTCSLWNLIWAKMYHLLIHTNVFLSFLGLYSNGLSWITYKLDSYTVLNDINIMNHHGLKKQLISLSVIKSEIKADQWKNLWIHYLTSLCIHSFLFLHRCQMVKTEQWIKFCIHTNWWAHGSVVGWGTMLKAGRSWVRFPMRSLDCFSIDLMLPAVLWPWGWPSLYQKWVAGIFCGQSVRKADNLTAICEPTVYKMQKPRRLIMLWVSTACYRDSFTFSFLFFHTY
jgi:hypothetical protein